MEREIFSFWDGVKTRKMDPLRIERALAVKQEQIEPLVEKAQIGKDEAQHHLAEIIAEVFNVKLLTDDCQDGLTESEVIDVYRSYLDWWVDVAKKKGWTPNSSPPTDGSENLSITRPSADSTPIDHESNSKELGPTHWERLSQICPNSVTTSQQQ